MGTLNHFGDPAVVAYLATDGTARIHFFAVADNGHLYVRSGIEFDVTWLDIGAMPSGALVLGPPAGVTYIDQGGRQIRVFVRGDDGRLNVAWFDGNIWQIDDLGTTPGGKIFSNVAAITYFFENSVQLIYAFVVGEDGQLYLNKWDGTQWSWVLIGAPPGGVISIPYLSAVNFDFGEPWTYVFASGIRGSRGGGLYMTREWINWPWTYLGRPEPGDSIREAGSGGPEAIGYVTSRVIRPGSAPGLALRTIPIAISTLDGRTIPRFKAGTGSIKGDLPCRS